MATAASRTPVAELLDRAARRPYEAPRLVSFDIAELALDTMRTLR